MEASGAPELLRRNVAAVRSRIAAAAARSGRPAEAVRVIAVTKSVDAARIELLAELGVGHVGENRAVEAVRKAQEVRAAFLWHFIGHLQTNKVKKVLERFTVIHSVDREALADELESRLFRQDRSVEIFVQVNMSGEKSKHGLSPENTAAFVGRLRAECPHLNLLGLMTMAPGDAAPETCRPIFRKLRDLASSCRLGRLSMGMSRDFEIAIEEGATDVRIGTALFTA
jgi:pyridoxal phosphate enzyme (YggS family)